MTTGTSRSEQMRQAILAVPIVQTLKLKFVLVKAGAVELEVPVPAQGTHLVARGRVVQASRLLTVCAADVFAVSEGVETLCATLPGTARNIDTVVRA